jgi:hypothetical protein
LLSELITCRASLLFPRFATIVLPKKASPGWGRQFAGVVKTNLARSSITRGEASAPKPRDVKLLSDG